jgi:hypothetical protein
VPNGPFARIRKSSFAPFEVISRTPPHQLPSVIQIGFAYPRAFHEWEGYLVQDIWQSPKTGPRIQ